MLKLLMLLCVLGCGAYIFLPSDVFIAVLIVLVVTEIAVFWQWLSW